MYENVDDIYKKTRRYITMDNVMANSFCELNDEEMMMTAGGETTSHAVLFGTPQQKAEYNLRNGTSIPTGIYTFWDAFFGRI